MKKVLILGCGAREHVIGETLLRSGHASRQASAGLGNGVELFVLGPAKNPGLAGLATEYEVASVTNFDAVREFVKKIEPDFVVPGPEAPIAAGVVDALAELGVPCVAPIQSLARLESSKSFTRDLLKKYNIPGNPQFRVFERGDENELEAYMAQTLGGQFVVKADGLKSGKGVKVVGDHLKDVAEGVVYARECIAESTATAGQAGRVVVEEKFVGQEFSLMSFVDGETVVDMVPVQDHKRAFENDEGPNTGGMGTYSDANHLLPFLTSRDLEEAHAITVQVAKALRTETGVPYRGVMYGGFIAVKDGVRLIEYNARFGDPEAMNVLCLLRTDFVSVCEAMVRGELKGMTVEFEKKATVCKYVVPNGYPEAGVKGEKIELGEVPTTKAGAAEGLRVYYGSVDQREDGLYLGGSRAVALVGIGETLEAAEKLAEVAASGVKGPVFHRKDIGTATLIAKKVEMMKRLRV